MRETRSINRFRFFKVRFQFRALLVFAQVKRDDIVAGQFPIRNFGEYLCQYHALTHVPSCGNTLLRTFRRRNWTVRYIPTSKRMRKRLLRRRFIYYAYELLYNCNSQARASWSDEYIYIYAIRGCGYIRAARSGCSDKSGVLNMHLRFECR